MCLSQRPPSEGHRVTRQRPGLVKLGRPARAGPSNRLKGLERTSMPGTFFKVTFKDGSKGAVFEDEVDLSAHTEAAVQ
jgi:hypothetical protein